MSFPPQLIRTLETLRDQAKDAVWALSSCLCQQTPKIKINGRTCKLLNFIPLESLCFLPLVWTFPGNGHQGLANAVASLVSPNYQGPRRGWILIRVSCPG